MCCQSPVPALPGCLRKCRSLDLWNKQDHSLNPDYQDLSLWLHCLGVKLQSLALSADEDDTDLTGRVMKNMSNNTGAALAVDRMQGITLITSINSLLWWAASKRAPNEPTSQYSSLG